MYVLYELTNGGLNVHIKCNKRTGYDGLDYTIAYIGEDVYKTFYDWYNTKTPITEYTDFPRHAFKLSESDTIEMIEKFGSYIKPFSCGI